MGRADIVTINLDGLTREEIIDKVVEAMLEIGASARDVQGFKDDAINADYDTMLAKAIGWQAPVRFLKDGEPWVRGDWRRLSRWQLVKRRLSLLGGSYRHPDGTIELDIDEKAGVDPHDSQDVQDAKLHAYIRQQSIHEVKAAKWTFLIIGIGIGAILSRCISW